MSNKSCSLIKCACHLSSSNAYSLTRRSLSCQIVDSFCWLYLWKTRLCGIPSPLAFHHFFPLCRTKIRYQSIPELLGKILSCHLWYLSCTPLYLAQVLLVFGWSAGLFPQQNDESGTWLAVDRVKGSCWDGKSCTALWWGQRLWWGTWCIWHSYFLNEVKSLQGILHGLKKLSN